MTGDNDGLSVCTTLIPNQHTPFRLHRHEHGPRGPFAVVHIGDDGYHVIHLREIATAERLIAVLAKARDWLATQQAPESNEARKLACS